MKPIQHCRRLLGWGMGLLLLLAGGAHALTWQRTLVNRGSATYVSLALDPQGHPHISRFDWFAQVLKYSHFDGQAWHTEVVDGGIPNAAGSSSGLALDSQGRPHISYIYSPNDAIRHLRYARWDGSAWRLTLIPDGGGDVSLALDHRGHPWISFYHIDFTTFPLVFAVKLVRFDGSAWQVETVDTEVNGKTSLALDTQGRVHVGYSSFSPDSLKYALGLPSPPPALDLTLTGCTRCRPGERLIVQGRLTNPGPTATPVEVKMGVRLPDGTPANVLGKHLEVVLPPQLAITVPLLDAVLPSGLPPGPWMCEGALLEPELGVTLSRSVQPFEVLP